MFLQSKGLRAWGPFVRCLTLAMLAVVVGPQAFATTFNVNSTADILSPPPGVVTLRSAIQAANATSGGNTINLTVPGVYKIIIPGANTGTNKSGAFAILPGGGNLKIVNTSGGLVVVNGNKLDRVFDINPGAATSPVFTVTMQGFTITDGLAQPGDGAPGSGGGIRSQSVANLTLIEMTVTENESTADGGGISMENVTNSTFTLTIMNSTISSNHAGDSGGGIDTDGSGNIALTGATISGNTSLNQGGGIILDGISLGTVFASANLTMQESTISDNKTLGSAGVGGGIANFGSGTVSIGNSLLQNNSSGNSGGGYGDLICQGTLKVSMSTILGNTAATSGGGIQTCGPTTTITFGEIDGNSAAGAGGAIFANGATLTIRNSTLANNTAAGSGGAIELETTGTGSNGSLIVNSTITNNTVESNPSSGNGGGIDASASFSGSLTLTDNTISSNFADNGGGIFYAATSGSSINVEDTVVATNSASAAGPDANNPAGSFTDGGGNLIGVAGAGSGNTGFSASTTLTGTAATPLNPLLGPLQNNGGPTQTEALLAGSPAINKGVTAAFTTDERGVPRPQGSKQCIGAFELNQKPAPMANPSTSILDFGSHAEGTSSTLEVAMDNNGTAALTISTVFISGANPNDFKFTGQAACPTVPATAPAGGACPYQVAFAPLGTGLRTAVLNFIDNDENAPNSSQTVTLSGTGFVKTSSTVGLALTTGTNPSAFGSMLTFTATVTPDTATGSVTFFDGATLIATSAVSGGIATFTSSSLAIGTHSITAHYGGDAFVNASMSAAVSQRVLAGTTTTLASSANPSVFGQTVTFTATVSAVSPATGTPTGTVTFKDGTTTLATETLVSGKATLATAALAVGSHSVTATYNGSTSFSTSASGAVAEVVNKATTTAALSTSVNPSKSGQAVTFTATVTAVSPGSGTSTGMVTFKDGTTTLATETLVSGKAALTTSSLAVGSHSITVVYAGDTDHNGVTSGTLTQTVQ